MWIIILVQSNNEVIHEYMWIIILVQSNNEVIHEYMWIIILVQSEWFIFVIRNKNSYTIYYIGLMFLFVLIRCLIKTGFSCLIKWNSSENDVLIDRFSTHNEFAFHHYSCEFEPRSWRGLLDTTLWGKVYQWLVTGWWFSLDTPVSSTNKTDSHDTTEILLNTINQTTMNFSLQSTCHFYDRILLLVTDISSSYDQLMFYRFHRF
jgi:hypothetical protein